MLFLAPPIKRMDKHKMCKSKNRRTRNFPWQAKEMVSSNWSGSLGSCKPRRFEVNY